MFDSQMTVHQERYRDLRREADTYRATRTTTFHPWRWLARSTRRPATPKPEVRPGVAM